MKTIKRRLGRSSVEKGVDPPAGGGGKGRVGTERGEGKLGFWAIALLTRMCFLD